jgi:hypothetical protein
MEKGSRLLLAVLVACLATVASAEQLRVVSDPVEAEVWMGSVRLGTTGVDGLQVDVSPGTLNVSVRKDGYWPAERKVTVAPGQSPTLLVQMLPADGSPPAPAAAPRPASPAAAPAAPAPALAPAPRLAASGRAPLVAAGGQIDYVLLATQKTSTLQKELNQMARGGYRLRATMGGGTAYGGDETVAIMARDAAAASVHRYEYKLLATNKTSTIQKEMQAEAREGFTYAGQSAHDTTFGGREVVVIMERAVDDPYERTHEYKLLATNKTSTMQKELREAGAEGFDIVGMTVAETMFGGKEIVSILERPVH